MPAQTHSYLLGLKLGLPVHVVDGIFATHLQPRDRLLHVLIAFLNQEEPQPTWEVVVGALRSPAVNLPQLAKAVEAKYSRYPPRTCDDIPTTTTTTVAGFYNNTRNPFLGIGTFICTIIFDTVIACCTFCTLLVLNVVWPLIQGLQICKA